MVKLVAFSIGIVLLPAMEAAKSFESKLHGYTVNIPDDWYSQAAPDVFYIESFPASAAVRGARIPMGGAGITISVPGHVAGGQTEIPKTLNDWVRIDTLHQQDLSSRKFDAVGTDRVVSITEVRSRCCSVPPIQETVQWYFEIKGHLFKALVVFWQGEPKESKFIETLRGVVLSIRLS